MEHGISLPIDNGLVHSYNQIITQFLLTANAWKNDRRRRTVDSRTLGNSSLWR